MNHRKGGVLGVDQELAVMQSIRRQLNKLDSMARSRVIEYFHQAVQDDLVNGAASAGEPTAYEPPEEDDEEPEASTAAPSVAASS